MEQVLRTLADTIIDDNIKTFYQSIKNIIPNIYLLKSQNTNYFDFINSIINDCEKYSGNVKTVRKTRKKKVISNDKKIAKLQFKKDDAEHKIVSINPTDIISAKQLWVYNTKYKKLGVYYSKDDSGFSVKGTTIENFDDITSIGKTLRKPLEILPLIVKGKKTDLKTVMKNLKTKEEKLYKLGVGVDNKVIDGTNGTLTPYIGGGVYWPIRLKK